MTVGVGGRHTLHTRDREMSASVSEPVNQDRSTLLSQARIFLRSPQASVQDASTKRSFLTERGLTPVEIDTLFNELVSQNFEFYISFIFFVAADSAYSTTAYISPATSPTSPNPVVWYPETLFVAWDRDGRNRVYLLGRYHCELLRA